MQCSTGTNGTVGTGGTVAKVYVMYANSYITDVYDDVIGVFFQILHV